MVLARCKNTNTVQACCAKCKSKFGARCKNIEVVLGLRIFRRYSVYECKVSARSKDIKVVLSV